MDKHTVSVIVPTYNQQNYISLALNSICSQLVNFKVEILVGDDCSTDDTGKICESFLVENAMVELKYFRHSQNIGVIKNWKFLLSKVTGDYIAVCEGDDYWTDANKLQEQLSILETDRSLSLCFHKARYFKNLDNTTIRYSGFENPTLTTIQDLALLNYMDNLTVMVRNYSVNGKYPEWVFNEMFPVPDYAWHMYNAQFGNIYFLNKVMADYRVREDSLWSTKSDVERAHGLLKALLPSIKSNIENNKVKQIIDFQILMLLEKDFIDEESENLGISTVDKSSIIKFYQQKSLKQSAMILELKNSSSYKIGRIIVRPIYFLKKIFSSR